MDTKYEGLLQSKIRWNLAGKIAHVGLRTLKSRIYPGSDVKMWRIAF